MEEEEEENEEEEKTKIKFVDDIPCIELEEGIFIDKTQNNSSNHPHTFGWLQETKERQFMPDIIKEIQKMFKFPIVPGEWKVFKIEDGKITEIKKEEEEDDNSE